MTIDQRKCEHQGCRCLVSADQRYCSRYCEEAPRAAHDHSHCDCGHGECDIAADIPLSAIGGA